MRLGFYPRLAADGIRKNRRLYLPYILTCVGMVMMFYIIMFLAVSDALDGVAGAEVLRSIFGLGSWVIAVFAAIFLFYTNSFLIRRRKKEFGLYNILGMGKLNLARVLVWETVITAVVSVVSGLAAGMLFSKLAELGMVNVMHGKVTYNLTVSWLAAKRAVQVFGVIFILLLLNSVRQIQFASAVQLLRSENEGEKPPRGNWLLGAAGAVLLIGAYFIAVTIKDPLTALMMFFLAVIMVIVGTYLVMIAGSVTFCRILQRNRGYYYKPNHFVSVSSMVYRMKRNGAGLASICILATMVLVMMASTTCLYFGEERALAERYPREIGISCNVVDEGGSSSSALEPVREAVYSAARERGADITNAVDYRSVNFSGIFTEDGLVETDPNTVNSLEAAFVSVTAFYLVPLEDYNACTGENVSLEDGEALVSTVRSNFDGEALTFTTGLSFRIAGRAEGFTVTGNALGNIVPTVFLFVPDIYAAVDRLLEELPESTTQYLVLRWSLQFDTGLDAEGQKELYRDLRAKLRDGGDQLIHFEGVDVGPVECREVEAEDFFSLYGSLFYIGIMLSIVFMFAAVLIIYYKQISEGYEDQARFDIMRKVGMTRREIRRSINSQLLTVFFLPLTFAVVHIVFAFPIIRKMLMLFNLTNVRLFAVTTGITVAAFAVFYTAVYKLTSNAYYNIVSGVREWE